MESISGYPGRKCVGLAIAGIVTLELGYQFVTWLRKRISTGNSRRQNLVYFKTILFPDKKVACRTHFTQRHGCTSQKCRFSHDPELSYSRFLRTLTDARMTVDVCVFCITCSALSEVLIDLHDMGVVVRVITDNEQVDARGSQIGLFRAAGIQVRIDKTSYLMHHKFAIVDKSVLINGSFNWTRQAITGNNENLIITNEPQLLKPFQDEFDKLWNLYDPSA